MGVSRAQAALLPEHMTLHGALQPLLLMCWVFMMFFKSLIKDNAVTMFLTHQFSTSERKQGLGKLGQLQPSLS